MELEDCLSCGRQYPKGPNETWIPEEKEETPGGRTEH